MSQVVLPPRPEASGLGRLVRTPLRDLLRGRVSGRLDVAGAIAEGGLPHPLPGLVALVVHRTRLHRLERADVARELVAHFADGLRQGVDPDTLAAAFGDPVQAARLIRRAKKRGRHWAWRATTRVAAAALVLVVVYAAAAVLLVRARPTPATDYLAVLNAPLAVVPAEDRAWPAYREALLRLEDPKPLLRAFTRTPRPGEEGWSEVERFLSGQAQALARARVAARRPVLGFELDTRLREEDLVLWPGAVAAEAPPQRLLIAVEMPYLAQLRKLAKVMVLDAWRAAAANDGDVVLEDLDAVLAMAAHVREAPFLINDLVAASLVTLATRTASDILAARPGCLDDDHLRRLAHRLAAIDPLLAFRADGERMMFEDVVQRVYTDDGHGDGHVTFDGLRLLDGVTGGSSVDPRPYRHEAALAALTPAMVVLMAGRADLMDAYDRIVHASEVEAQRPLWEREGVDAAPGWWERAGLERLRYLPLGPLVPVFGKATVNLELALAERDAVLVAIALERHRRLHGAWPERLDELVPDLLPRVPLDRFDGRPLRYVLTENRPLVYSVSTDRDDDGGAPAARSADRRPGWVAPARLETTIDPGRQRGRRPWPRVPDGDWILWPAPVPPLARYDG